MRTDITASDITKVAIGADRHAEGGSGVGEVGICAGRVALVDEGIAVEACWTLSKASSVGVGEGAFGAGADTAHSDIVDEAVGNAEAGADTGPIVSFILHVVVGRAGVDTHFDIGVHVGEHLHSIYDRAVQSALTVDGVAVVIGWACRRLYTLA